MPNEVADYINKLEAELGKAGEDLERKMDNAALQQAEIDLLFKLGSAYIILGADSNATRCFQRILEKRPLKPIREMSPAEDATQVFALLALYSINAEYYHADVVAVGLYSA